MYDANQGCGSRREILPGESKRIVAAEVRSGKIAAIIDEDRQGIGALRGARTAREDGSRP